MCEIITIGWLMTELIIIHRAFDFTNRFYVHGMLSFYALFSMLLIKSCNVKAAIKIQIYTYRQIKCP